MKITSILLPLALLLFACGEKTDETTVAKDGEVVTTDAGEEIAEAECNSLESFIPEAWEIVKKVKGDLNKDGINDVAMVLQDTDPRAFIGEEPMRINSNDRKLIILFGQKKAGCYTLNVKSETFILKHEQENMDDPFEDISISKGTLKISFIEFYNMGGSDSGSYSYIWRFQEGEFKLIGANSIVHNRMSGDGVEASVNFSTNKYSLTSFNIADEEVDEVETWKKLKLKELKTFSTFKEPWSWKINEDLYF